MGKFFLIIIRKKKDGNHGNSIILSHSSEADYIPPPLYATGIFQGLFTQCSSLCAINYFKTKQNPFFLFFKDGFMSYNDVTRVNGRPACYHLAVKQFVVFSIRQSHMIIGHLSYDHNATQKTAEMSLESARQSDNKPLDK